MDNQLPALREMILIIVVIAWTVVLYVIMRRQGVGAMLALAIAWLTVGATILTSWVLRRYNIL